MTDPKTTLKAIVASIPRHDRPVEAEPVTRVELERRAKEEAEEEARQEAQRAYDEAYAEAYEAAYERILEELLDEHGFSD